MNSENQNSQRQVKCPQCGRLSFYSVENLFRPFCCERCKLIDLGQWADQSYKIPVPAETIESLGLLDDAGDFEPKE